MKRYLIVLLPVLIALATVSQAMAVAPVHVLRVDGQIDPAIADYLSEGIREASDEGAQAVLVLMDTPGGLLDSTREIIQAFYASRVPVIVYVHPEGAWAASAGAFITMAADIAAMSPGTSIGASTPVSIAPGGEVAKPGEAMEKKQVNFTAEYAKSIAEKRGRNVEWAEAAVREAASLTATNAQKKGVIDYVARNPSELMNKVDGRKVKLVSGETITLRTANAPLEEKPMGLWETFLHLLSNPYVTLFLTMAAMYGIIYELANPGSIFPGVIGAISIILLLYSYSVIPVNTAGFAFIGLAVLLFVVELFTPTNGILAAGGVVSMFIGLVMLFRNAEGFMVSLWTLGLVAVATGAFFFFLIGLGVKALRRPYIAGREGVVGHVGEARSDLNPTGQIFVDGAIWTATSEDGTTISAGEQVEVTEMIGLKLRVRKAGRM